MSNIVLIGMPCSGKSVIAARLAKHLRRRHRDTDGEIEAREGRSIAEIFADKGEPFFRRREKQMLAEVLQDDRQVVSAGGGIVVSAANRRLLRQHTAVFLQAPLPLLIARAQKSRTPRPLLNASSSSAVADLWRQRKPWYQKTALVTVLVDEKKTLIKSVYEIVSALQKINAL